ncbi:MAG: galactitol-1-phosphate 5-dehydrogenase [Zetaproteobacteria bacterium]|nr:MAG: galactitol-1-phosphate 5-dehydrogenase [Zetaproteobacteria bacterium]
MKALFYPAWDRLEIRDVPEPSPKPGEVLLKVLAVGICGSELHGFKIHAPRRTPPLIMGHEFSGEVLAVGPGVSGFRVGEVVAVNSTISCGACDACVDGDPHVCPTAEVYGTKRPGAFAELVAAPVPTLLRMPGNVTPVQASLMEPLGNGVHAWSMIRRRFPETVAIFGAGAIGLLTMQVALAGGAGRVAVVDVSPARLAVAKRLGADRTLDARRDDVLAGLRDFTRGRGADVAIDAVGAAATRDLAVKAIRKGCECVWLGLHDDATSVGGLDIVLGEKAIYGSFAVRPRDLHTALDLLGAGKIALEPWVRTFPLADGAKVFTELVTAPPDDYIKAVLLPH